MVLKKLGVFIAVIVVGVVLGVMVIENVSVQLSLPTPLKLVLQVVYSLAFIVVAVILGKDIPKEEVEKSEEEVKTKKKPGKAYAWLVPASGRIRAGFPITKKLMILGRDVHSDILINEPSVSKKHAQILSLQGGFLLKDLDSSNGTYINNSRIEEAYLGDGDTVTLGEAKFTFACSQAIQQPSKEGKEGMSAEFDLDLDDLVTKIHTATMATEQGKAVEGKEEKKKDPRLKDMPFKPPKGFKESDEEETVPDEPKED